MKSSYPESKIILACLSGPDIGKRFAVERQQVVVGRSTDAELLSEDPDVAPHHVIFRLSENTPSFTTIDGSVVFVDGHPTEAGTLAPKQQIRIGRSLWHVVEGQPKSIAEWLDNVGGRISTAAGVEKIQGFNIFEIDRKSVV